MDCRPRFWATIQNLLLSLSTVGSTVVSKTFLISTVDRGFGQQFKTCFFDSLLPRPHKMAVQKQKSVSHTAISKDDFSEGTVVRAKAREITADFIVSS